jgi:type VI secretion system secreted protein VgrG
MNAALQFTVTSEDEIIISTPKKLTLNGGGAYVTLSEGGIEEGTGGDYVVRASRYQVPMSSATMDSSQPVFDKTNLNLLPSATNKNLSR